MPETKLESRTPRAADTAQPQPKSHGLALKDRRHLAVTGVMWVGIGLMVISGTAGLIRKRRSSRNNRNN